MGTELTQLVAPWMVLTAFVLSVALAALRVIKLIGYYLKLPKLSVRLTREVFFRLTEDGENLFANAVLLARGGPIEIRDVRFRLSRMSGSRKQYDLVPSWFGEKVRDGNNVIANHHFNTTSALDFVPENSAKRTLYMASLSEYGEQIAEVFRRFRAGVARLNITNVPLNQLDDDTARSLLSRLADLQREGVDGIMPQVQIEPGDYQLSVQVTYRRVGRWASDRLAESSISFVVSEDPRTQYRWELERTLNGIAAGMVLDQAPPPTYPTYQPSCLKEL